MLFCGTSYRRFFRKTVADAKNESVAMSSIANSIVTKLYDETVICATCDDEGCA